eukprot:TRINITY_DN335_c0_g2_i3.p1 TRINITY_DN335_c0_g2~~TRINITY_DN335_c0_g2_i3.p1  ORF type:complete len:159 (-),score=21.49 TRINITY_DN335_c0_g2_i3:281-757(-)
MFQCRKQWYQRRVRGGLTSLSKDSLQNAGKARISLSSRVCGYVASLSVHCYPASIVVKSSKVPGKEQILLIKRKNPPQAGHWSFPGGKVKFGELLQDAVMRELKEETNLTVELKGLVDVVDVIRSESTVFHYIVVEYLSVVQEDAIGTSLSLFRCSRL